MAGSRLIGFMLVMMALACTNESRETVVLLHGLARTGNSMAKLENALEKDGYNVINISYPSRRYTVEELSGIVRRKVMDAAPGAERLNFVTHSLGGILLRYIQSTDPFDSIGRVVMLSPPNQGSEVVDKLGDMSLFRWINGPAGSQLSTATDGISARLGPIDFVLGVITGDRSINWILSMMIPGKDDGKVSVQRSQVEGMADFKVIYAAHPFIMKNRHAIRLVREFLKHGKFNAVPPDR